MPARIQSRERIIAGLADVFREHGFEGASLAHISKATGLGKGSLYHAFPGGKDDMAAAVLNDIDAWFEAHVFAPLDDQTQNPAKAVDAMLDACAEYFYCGGRVCLVGVFALSDTRDAFATAVHDYFRRWETALSGALRRAGAGKAKAKALAEETLARIQGALTLARAFDDTMYFEREIIRLRKRLKEV